MNKLEAFKLATELVVSVGVSAIVGGAIKTYAPVDVNVVKKVCIAVGGFALSGMVADKSSRYAKHQVDLVADTIEKATAIIKEESEKN